MLEPVMSRRGFLRGLTIVELLVGMAVGLFLVASGAMLLSNHLRDQRGLLLEARLMQDLRSAADLIARDLRRAGYWGDSIAGIAAAGVPALANPYAALAPQAASSDAVYFRYSRDAIENGVVDVNEVFGYRLRNAAVQVQLGAGNWQALTDATLLRVSGLSITPMIEEISLAEVCSQPCSAGSATCPPRQSVRSLVVQINARSVTDANITRSIQTTARLRNDTIVGACST